MSDAPVLWTFNMLCCSPFKNQKGIISQGPPDNSSLPKESLGIIFYNGIQKREADKIALIDSDNKKVKYSEIFTLSIKLAKKLRSIGVKKNEVLTIISHNQWKYLVTVIAGLYIGATVNPLNPDYSSGELKHFLSICKPLLVFCTTQVFNRIVSLKKESFYPPHIIIYDTETSEEINFDTFVSDVDDKKILNPVEADPKNDVAFIFTSSGTTGLPKCVELTHWNFRLTMVYSGDPLFLNIQSLDTLILFLPFFHIFGNAMSLAGILYGAKVVIMRCFQPKVFLELIQEHKITKLYLVPTIVHFLAKNSLVEEYDLSSVKDVVSAAAPLTLDLERALIKILKLKVVRQVYGMTEISGAATMITTNIKMYGSVGKVTTTHQIKVVNLETEKMLPPYETGELRLKGEGLMKGYLGNKEETQNALDKDGFLKTGDLGYYDNKGLFYIVGRIKEIITCRGFQVSPVELENLLLLHPAVTDVGVVGKPDPIAGEVPFAFVVKAPQAIITEAELVKYVAEHISPVKCLQGGVKFVQAIPKNAVGKILRKQLKEML